VYTTVSFGPSESLLAASGPRSAYRHQRSMAK
jgi:hypothetical protein